MKIANADKLKEHFENVVDVKLFTPAQILTIIDHFSAEITEGKKYVFSYDYDGTPIVTDLDAKQKEEELLGIASEEHKEGEWIDRTNFGYVECPYCGEKTSCFDKTAIRELHYCFSCGAHMIGGDKP